MAVVGYYYNEAVALDRPVLFSMESAVLRDVGDSDEGGCCDKAVAHYRPVLPSIEEEMEGVCERVSPVVVDSGAAGAAGASLRRGVLACVTSEKVGAAVVDSGAVGAAGTSLRRGALVCVMSEKVGAAVVGSGAACVTSTRRWALLWLTTRLAVIARQSRFRRWFRSGSLGQEAQLR
jgi:hypothetical protein